MPRRLASLAAALAALLCCASPALAQPESTRIINGTAAAQGEYPAQGFLELATIQGTFVCGGSLLSNRHFLTAAHCATQPDTTIPLDPGAFTVMLGKADKDTFQPSDERGVTANAVHEDYDLLVSGVPENDLALLTLADPAPAALDPLRLIEADESPLWADGVSATIIGWGETESGSLSDTLLEAAVPMRSDAYCGDADVWGSSFSAATMVCAGGGETDTCGGDSGGPLMVGDGSFPVLAGLTSWGENQCATPDIPGVYTRLGAPALNAWVRERVPMARASVSDATVDAGQSATFSATATGGLTTFAWDFDSNGTTDATGASVSHAYPAAGRFVARVAATGAGADRATDRVRVQVADGDPPAPEPTPAPTAQPPTGATPPVTTTPPVASPRVPLATILVSRRPRVRGGRFPLRVRFAGGAPAGTAVIEVIRRGRTIGIARTRVLRGGTKRVRVKLTPQGRRLLSRGRLKVNVRVRVGRRVLRSRSLTLPRRADRRTR